MHRLRNSRLALAVATPLLGWFLAGAAGFILGVVAVIAAWAIYAVKSNEVDWSQPISTSTVLDPPAKKERPALPKKRVRPAAARQAPPPDITLPHDERVIFHDLVARFQNSPEDFDRNTAS